MAVRTQVQDWLKSKVFPWPPQPPTNKIDTHHHWVPAEYAQAVADAGGDPSGWPTPSWTLESTELLMGHNGIKTAILSITAPGACTVEGKKSWDLARLLNVKAAAIRDGNPTKFGFFVSLANVLETKAALEEIEYAFDVLGADGVCLFTRYGRGHTYLGHPDIQPIWAELNRRKAVVFVHPTHSVDTTPINSKLPQPSVDYPHETTRTAMDMLSNATLDKYPDVKVILSHAGGTLPYVISRVTTPLEITADAIAQTAGGMTYKQMMGGFRKFYFDLALSASPNVINLLYKLVPADHILYGSDFPYAPPPAYPAFLKSLENTDLTSEQREAINYRNAMSLFPRLHHTAAL